MLTGTEPGPIIGVFGGTPTPMSWPTPLRFPHLGQHQVHVWCVGLDVPGHLARCATEVLSADERERAERYVFERDRRRFVVGRAVLRGLLGRYLDVPATSLRFRYNEYGKPALADPVHRSNLQFNLAHSGDLALLGFSLGRAIGIDVEMLRPDTDLPRLAERFFSTDEARALRELPPEQRGPAFFRCWTRKEAYIKGRSEGLSIPLESFSVSLVPGEPPALLRHRDDPAEVERWTMVDTSPGPEAMGALAIEGHVFSIQRWQAAPDSLIGPSEHCLQP